MLAMLKTFLLSIIDIREVSKISSFVYIMAFLAGFFLASYFFFLGLYISGYSTLIYCFCLSAVLYLKRKALLHKLEYFFLLIVITHLIVSALIEGAATGQYFYFFPLLVSLPVIINPENSKYRTLFLNFGITVLSFLVCILIGFNFIGVELIPANVSSKIFLINSCSSMLMTAGFAFTFIYYQKLNFEDQIEQKNNSITSRTRFLSTMGHELRTPLNGVLGAVNLLKDEKYLSEDNEYFRVLKYCAGHMLNLVNDILDFNKIEAGKLEIHPVEFNLKNLIADSTLPFYNSFEEKNLQLKIEIAPELNAMVMGDDIRIIQILNNLLSNALKFTNKGYVKLSVLCSQKDTQFLTALFKVEDTGLGIDKADQSKIFDSFWQGYDESTRKYSGTGLGLSICIRLLELMNSALKLKSEKGKGSTFSFEIKFKLLANQLSAIEGVKNTSEDLEGMKILVVEDNKINMMIAKKILTGFKATVSCAFDGKEALDILKLNADYSLILMDLEMPVMNGYTAIAEVKKMYPNVPALAFTASLIDQEMLVELLSIGFTDFIPKPFEPHQMLALIKKYAVVPQLN